MVDAVTDNAHRDRVRPETGPGKDRLSTIILLAFAMTCGISVANIYYAQPLLDALADGFAIDPASIGLAVTLTQAGYAAGLLLIVPLGDLIDRRRLILAQTFGSAIALVLVGTAPNSATLFCAMIGMGLLAVVIQVIVAYTAALATPARRGSAVGLVTSGVVIGILSSRTVAGALADIGGWRAVYLTSAGVMLTVGFLLAYLLPSDQRRPCSESYGAVLRSMVFLLSGDRVLQIRAVLALFTFASFGTLWTAIVLPLRAPPLSLSHTAIGLFGLAGVAGAVAANGAGRLVDRGHARSTTAVALMLLTASWAPMTLLHHSLAALVAGIVVLDLSVQAIHVTNQTVIFARHSEARSRLVGCYMLFYSIGSGIGAIASTTTYAAFGWVGVAALGAGFGAAGLLVWLTFQHVERDA
jgi:predicted MFS family arabinose efflux permease